MTFRILHTSDWHLGQHFYGKSRADEHQQFLTWLLMQVKEHHIDAVIVAGDIFDTGTPPSYAREMYFDFVVKMHACQCQLVILAGNHDSVAVLGEAKQLLSHLSCTVVPIAYSDSESHAEQICILKNGQGEDGAVLCAIPYIRPRDIITSVAGQSAKDKQQSLLQGITEHYRQLFNQAKAQVEKSNKPLPIIATGHLTTIGVTSSESVRDIYIGTLEAFPARDFPDADYIALGHIHRSQKVAKSEHIRYCGSPIPLSFDEAKQDKKVLIAEFNQAKLSQVNELVIPCFQPLAMVKTTLDSVTDDIELLVKNTQLNDDKQKLWLDIEINSAGYLQDLTPRITAIVEDLPVEVLLVRRSKKFREAMPNSQKKVTLNELTLEDVFATRLDKETWQTEQEEERKQRLYQLFTQALEQVQQEAVELNNQNNSNQNNNKAIEIKKNAVGEPK